MARIIRDTQVRHDRDLRLALPLGARRALRARDVSRLAKVADDAKPDPKTGRLVMSFRAARDLIAARFKRLRDVFA